MSGRPRSFDEEQALDAAMRVFWRHGYHEASYERLTGAMRLARPSVYAAFGQKEELFLRCVERYLKTWATPTLEKLYEAGPVREAVSGFFRAVVENVIAVGPAGGCLVATVLSGCAELSPRFRAKLREIVAAADQALERRVRLAQRQGELRADVDPAQLARTLNNARYGLACRARSGASRAELLVDAERAAEFVLGPFLAAPAPPPPMPAATPAATAPKSSLCPGAGAADG